MEKVVEMSSAPVFIDLVDSDDDDKSTTTSIPSFEPNVSVIIIEKPDVKEADSRKNKRCRDSEIDRDQEQPGLPTSVKAKRNELGLAQTDPKRDTSHTRKEENCYTWTMEGVLVPFKGREITISTKLRVPQNEVAKAPLPTQHTRGLPMLASAGPVNLARHSSIQAALDPSESCNGEVKETVDRGLLSSPSFSNSCLEKVLSTSQNYQQIHAQLKKTCPEIEVLKIERLDDPRRRKKYDGHKTFLSDAKVRNQL
jgi:hypothetical protein